MKRLAVLVALAALVGGCFDGEHRAAVALRHQVTQQEQQIRELRSNLVASQSELTAQKEQINTLQALGGPDRLNKLFHVTRIQLGQYTGGYKPEGAVADAGVRVYLQPIDNQGSVVKASGSVTIQMFDLSEPPQANLLAECNFPVDQVATHWSSGFLTYHYSFDCPWPPAGGPKHDEITLRVTFVDYLTGKSFTTQKAVKVTLPAQSTTTTAAK